MSPAAPRSVGRDPDGTGGPHVFVEDLEAPELDPGDRHHLARVVRLRAGDRLTVGDGRGNWRAARFGPTIEPEGETVSVPAESDPVTVGFALLKGTRIDDVTRHLTELGVDVIVPFAAERSVVRWDENGAAKRHRRLVRIAAEASMQCRRAWLPRVEPVTTFTEVVRCPGSVVAQMGAPGIGDDARCVLVGPEGGFSAAELAAAGATCSLARNVLRAETAALTAGALLADRRSRRR